MQTEWKYVVDEFDKNFSDRANKRIVIYGIGKHTKAIIDKLGAKYNIIGLMDAEKAGQALWGYEIFDSEMLEKSNADFIVIVARPSVHQIIYRRIEDVVERNHIPVYSIKGERVVREEERENFDNPYFNINREKLIEQIERHDIISFDVFDTLIMRKTMYPKDVFLNLDTEWKDNIPFLFSEARINAEWALKKETYPTLSAIYDELQRQQGLSKQKRDELYTAEISKEKSVIIQRREMCEVYQYCIAQGKKVILVSDMYLAAKDMKEILKNCGIEGYDELIISCEYGRAKQEGLLRELLKFGEAKTILHIGDNENADIKTAKSLGISAFKIMSAAELLENSSYCQMMEFTDKLYNRNLIGLIISEIFNSPFALYGTKGVFRIQSIEQMAGFIAPVMLSYVYWLIEMAEEYEASDILFVARDGYLPKQIYNAICKECGLENMPDGKYVYTSGRASSVAAAFTAEEVLPLIEEFKGDSAELFRNVFGVSNCCVNPDNSIEENVFNNMDTILEEAAIERKSLTQYLKSQKINFDGNVLYFDIFSKGTGQDNFERIMGRKLIGIYLNKTISGLKRRNEMNYCSFYEANNHYEKDYNIFKGYSLLEYIFSSPDPCLFRMKDGKPVFYPEDRSDEGIRFLLEMQKKVLEFGIEFCKMQRSKYHIDRENRLEDIILGMLFDKSKIEKKLIPSLTTYEWFRGAYKVVGTL